MASEDSGRLEAARGYTEPSADSLLPRRPICVAEHLIPFLPGNPVTPSASKDAIGPISAASYGSASISSISWAFIKMLGADGLKLSSKVALLNANYAMNRLKDHYRVRFVNKNNRCAHEFLIDLAEFDDKAGLKVMDIAKRLQDFGIHPPTCSWPISTAMLVSRPLAFACLPTFHI